MEWIIHSTSRWNVWFRWVARASHLGLHISQSGPGVTGLLIQDGSSIEQRRFPHAPTSECSTLRLRPSRVSMININPDLGLTKVAQLERKPQQFKASWNKIMISLDKHNRQKVSGIKHSTKLSLYMSRACLNALQTQTNYQHLSWCWCTWAVKCVQTVKRVPL